MNFETMRVLSETDELTFKRELSRFGLRVVGNNEYSNLNPVVQKEQVEAMGSLISEDVDERLELTRDQRLLKNLAESKGFIVVVENAGDLESDDDFHEEDGDGDDDYDPDWLKKVKGDDCEG